MSSYWDEDLEEKKEKLGNRSSKGQWREDIQIQSQIFISYHIFPSAPQILNWTVKQEVQCDTRNGI